MNTFGETPLWKRELYAGDPAIKEYTETPEATRKLLEKLIDATINVRCPHCNAEVPIEIKL